MKMRRGAATALVLALATALGCSSIGKTPERYDPTVRTEKLLDAWRAARADGRTCVSGGGSRPFIDCGRIQAAIESLALDFPTHPTVLTANAILAFETNQPEKAQDYLDALIEQSTIEPELVVLRSRVAIQQGNLPFARRLLDEQVMFSPDSPELREALAAVYYLEGDHDAARRELEIAHRLGAPRWRIAFNRGLLAEADGNYELARKMYGVTTRDNPDFQPAWARLRGIKGEHGN